ncbi:MAG TPA: hypothetical protein PLY87_03860 [Planctomycetaceae bacterium]|nr:hypothetical protein [Planctomycetaceae bacterium]HQZ64181.1 hypothetical protein [Planctomycetaceae bacterium]
MKKETLNRQAVCFVIVYFGEWPEWIDYFMRSCEENPAFHWLIFSDCGPALNTPKNVSVQEINAAQFEELVARKLGTAYQFSYGYKLCDLKPAYGHIFSEWLNEFTFWGYTDLDVVYGDLSRFVDEHTLEAFDFICASDRILVGHFTLVRNTGDLALLYQSCEGYLEKLCSPNYEVFDEKDYAVLVKSLAVAGTYRLFEKSIQTDDCIIWWSGRSHFLIAWWNGRLYDVLTTRPLGYFHFIQSKHRPYFRIKSFKMGLRCFYVDARGIHPLAGAVDLMRFTLSILQSFSMTIPWYAKNVLKRILSNKARLRIRTTFSR